MEEDSTRLEIIEEKMTRTNGNIIIKKYSKGKFLGKGGFAKCYELTDLDSNTVYAAKIVVKSTITKTKTRQKLMSEIKIHRSLCNPHILKFERCFEDSQKVYIVLEICENQTLKELLKRRKQLTELEVQSYTQQIVKGLIYLHSRKVIHRDVKLGNLFLSSTMDIKLGDFGLAARIGFEGERRRTVCGTPNYIAPEILESKNGHSYEVDSWSLGVVIYTLLVGKPPFETPHVKTTYRKIKINTYTFPENADLSPESIDLIRKLLVTKPENRIKLTDILNHDFLTKNSIPKQLPVSTLATKPTQVYIKQFQPNGCVSTPSRERPTTSHLDGTAPSRATSKETNINPQKLKFGYGGLGGTTDKIQPQTRAGSRLLQPTSSNLTNTNNKPNNAKENNIAGGSIPEKSSATAADAPIPIIQKPAGDDDTSPKPIPTHQKLSTRNTPGSSPDGTLAATTRYPLPGRKYLTQQRISGGLQHQNTQPQLKIPKQQNYMGTTSKGTDIRERITPAGLLGYRPTKSMVEKYQSLRQPLREKNTTTNSTTTGLYNTNSVSSTTRPVSTIPTFSLGGTTTTTTTINQGTFSAQGDVSARTTYSQTMSNMGLHRPNIGSFHGTGTMSKSNIPPGMSSTSTGFNYGNNKRTSSPATNNLGSALGLAIRQSAVTNTAPRTINNEGIKLSGNNYKRGVSASVPINPYINTGGGNFNGTASVLVWIDKYIDYTEKFGVGYVLSNGSIGFCYNDYTSNILDPNSHMFKYADFMSKDQNEYSGIQYNLHDYPKNILKKVKILKYFKKNIYEIARGISPSYGCESSSKKLNLEIYVKRFLKTKQAMLFRLNNGYIQMCFKDGTQILLNLDTKRVSYLNKRGQRFYTTLINALNSGDPQMQKRVKYTMEILNYLGAKKHEGGEVLKADINLEGGIGVNIVNIGGENKGLVALQTV